MAWVRCAATSGRGAIPPPGDILFSLCARRERQASAYFQRWKVKSLFDLARASLVHALAGRDRVSHRRVPEVAAGPAARRLLWDRIDIRATGLRLLLLESGALKQKRAPHRP